MRTLNRLMETAGLPPSARDKALDLMAAPGRYYHGIGHLGVLWRRHEHFVQGSAFCAPVPNRLVACAIVFHDAIYDPTRGDNELRSAALWRDMAPADLAAEQVAWVTTTIEATADHLACTDAGSELARLRLWMLDLDLTPLGAPPAVFTRNTTALRQEFAHLDEAEWGRRRVAFLRTMQAAPRIFRSAPLAAAFEDQARQNIAQALREAG